MDGPPVGIDGHPPVHGGDPVTHKRLRGHVPSFFPYSHGADPRINVRSVPGTQKWVGFSKGAIGSVSQLTSTSDDSSPRAGGIPCMCSTSRPMG